MATRCAPVLDEPREYRAVLGPDDQTRIGTVTHAYERTSKSSWRGPPSLSLSLSLFPYVRRRYATSWGEEKANGTEWSGQRSILSLISVCPLLRALRRSITGRANQPCKSRHGSARRDEKMNFHAENVRGWFFEANGVYMWRQESNFFFKNMYCIEYQARIGITFTHPRFS